jgi:hypothetical protein
MVDQGKSETSGHNSEESGVKPLPIIFLTPREIKLATRIGELRHHQAMDKGYKAVNKMPPEKSELNHVSGAIGEYAVSKYFELEFSLDIDRFTDKPDVGPFSVRTYSSKTEITDCHLLAQPKDAGTQHFILASWQIDSCRVAILGYCPGYRLIAEENFRDHFKNGRECYAIHARDLAHPDEALKVCAEYYIDRYHESID